MRRFSRLDLYRPLRPFGAAHPYQPETRTEKLTMKANVATKAPARVNGVDLETLNETITVIQNDPGLGQSKFRARNKWMGGNQNRTTVSGFYAAREEIPHKQAFEMQADESSILAGDDEAPNRSSTC